MRPRHMPHMRKPLEFVDTKVLAGLPFNIIHSNELRKLISEFDLACDEDVPQSNNEIGFDGKNPYFDYFELEN